MRQNETPTERSGASPVIASQNASGERPTKRRLLVQSVLATLLIIYWASMFFGTHIPKLPAGLAKAGDKGLHFCGYTGLGILLMSWRASRGRFVWKTPLLLWFLLAAYGAFDEVTQIPVGRDAEVNDWFADLAGAACGLGLALAIARWISIRRRERAPPTI
jgi:VanZ family protein